MAAAGFVGTFIEYYDFALYGLLTVYFSQQFFPADSPSTSFLISLAVFGAGFVARPIGGILFGLLGDRRGRRTALVASLVLMGASSGLIGLLPTTASIGVWATVLLVALRLLQGVSAGSELPGSITFIMESTPAEKRTFLMSMTPFGSSLGVATATAMAWVLGATADKAWMMSTGWRIPFLVSIPLTLVALWIRTRVPDSPEFQKLVAERKVAEAPLAELFRRHWRIILVASFVAIGVNGSPALIAYFSTFLVGGRQIAASTVFGALTIASLVGTLGIPIVGRLATRHGRARVARYCLLLVAVATVPIFLILASATSFGAIVVAMSLYTLVAFSLMPAVFPLVASTYPTEVRYTGNNLSQTIGTILGAGLAPFAVAQLSLGAGFVAGPIIWMGLMVVIGYVGLALLMRVRRQRRLDPAA
ncbi:MFS transporter [Pseudonocardia ailaonensis]|uniref:MFS transporter n=1 Tax=Pseudonocardia ailaonensis TaxID=367279 RepID=A0ABN2NC39_9PSEU